MRTRSWKAVGTARPPAERRRHSSFLRRAILDCLEQRLLLSAAHDITGITALRADPLYDQYDGTGITIVLFDTGVYASNPDLDDNFLGYVNAVSPGGPLTLTTNQSIANSDATKTDGHGTHTAGIAASSNPEIGAAPGAKFISIRNLSYSGESRTVNDYFHPGVQWVLANRDVYNIKVVNISEGNPYVNTNDPADEALSDAQLAADVLALENAGIAVVVSSGNNYAQFADGTTDAYGNSSPAVFSKIAVGNTIADTIDPNTLNQAFGNGPDYYAMSTALGSPDQIEATSQRSNLSNQIFAPGDNINSTWLGNEHKSESGTSMSAPLVSGIVALMQQAAWDIGHSYLTVSVIANILQSTADTIVDNSISTNLRIAAATFASAGVLPTTGLTFKRVNAYKALQFIRAMFTLPPGQQFMSISGPIQQLPDLTGTEAFDVSGSISHPNDVNLYKLNLLESSTFKVFLTLPVNGGNSFQSTLRLFNSAGSQVNITNGTVDSNNMLTLQTDPLSPLAVGTYYLGVSSGGNNSYDPVAGNGADNGFFLSDYRLNINIINPDPNGAILGAGRVDLKSPDDILKQTTPLNTTSHYTALNTFAGTLGSDPAVLGSVDTNRINVDNGDVDMYFLQAPDDGKVSLKTTGNVGGNAYMRVFVGNTDGTYTQIASTVGQNASANTSTLTFTTQLGKTYYFGVSTFGNDTYDPKNPYGRPVNNTPHAVTRTYNLTIVFDNGDRNGIGPGATNATVGQTITTSIGADSNISLADTDPATRSRTGFTKDVDWYLFKMPSTGLFDLHLNGSGSGFTADLAMWYYDSFSDVFTRIASSSGGNELVLQVVQSDAIYVTVSDLKNSDFGWGSLGSGSGGGTGTYTLTSSVLPSLAFKTLNNDSLNSGTPTPATLGKSIDATIGMDGAVIDDPSDVDLYTFRAPTNGIVTLNTLTQVALDSNTVIRVFDSTGKPLATSQSQTFKSLGGKLNIAVSAGKDYIIGICGASFDLSNYDPVTGTGRQYGSTGHYRLSISNVTPPPVRVIFSTQPTGIISGQPMNPVITVNVVDANNKTVNGDSSLVTLKIVTGPAGGVLSGTTTVQAIDGVAVFNALTFSKPGAYVLRASDGTLTTADSNPINVTLPSAKLVVTQQPLTTVAGGTFGFIVSLEDITGKVVTTDTSDVTVSIFSGPSNSTLIGTLTVAANAGVATFTGLSLTTSGTYVLSVIDGTLTAGKTSNLVISPDATTARLVLSQPASPGIVGKALLPALTFGVKDQFGNLVTTNKSQVVLSLIGGPSGGAMTGTTTVTVANGLAVFKSVILSMVGDYTLSASSATLPITTPVELSQSVTPGVTTVVAPKTAAAYIFGPLITLSTAFKSNAPTNIPFTGSANITDALNNVLGTATLATNGAVKFILAGITTGVYTCTVNYAGDTNHTSVTSSAFTLTVNLAKTTTKLVLTPASLVFGQQLTLTANVATTTAPLVARTGTITFFDGINQIGDPVALNGSSAAAITISPTAGAHAYKAVYSGDTLFLTSTSSNASKTVGKTKTSILLTPSLPGPIVHGTSIDLGVQLTVIAPGAGIPTGNVTFKDGTKILGVVALDGTGSATLAALNFTTVGLHTLTAVYAGDLNDNPITSTAFKLTVT